MAVLKYRDPLTGQWFPLMGATTGAGYKLTIGDNVTTTFTLSHNFGNIDLDITCFAVGAPPWDGGRPVFPDISRNSPNTVTITFSQPPPTASVRVLIAQVT